LRQNPGQPFAWFKLSVQPLPAAATSLGSPRHVAIIMDAMVAGECPPLPRADGATGLGSPLSARPWEAAIELAIPYLTPTAFRRKLERPTTEIADLMGLLRNYIRDDLGNCIATMSRSASSARGPPEGDIIALLEDAQDDARQFGLKLTIAQLWAGRSRSGDAPAHRRMTQPRHS